MSKNILALTLLSFALGGCAVPPSLNPFSSTETQTAPPSPPNLAWALPVGEFVVRIIGEIQLRFAHIRFPMFVVLASAGLVVRDIDAVIDFEIVRRAVVE